MTSEETAHILRHRRVPRHGLIKKTNLFRLMTGLH